MSESEDRLRSEAEAAKHSNAEGDDAPPSEVVAAEAEQPAPDVDPSEDTRSPDKRPDVPEGKKLFIGGISWRSDEGKLKSFFLFIQPSSRRRRCFASPLSPCSFRKKKNQNHSTLPSSPASIRNHFERFGQLLNVVRGREKSGGAGRREEGSSSPMSGGTGVRGKPKEEAERRGLAAPPHPPPLFSSLSANPSRLSLSLSLFPFLSPEIHNKQTDGDARPHHPQLPRLRLRHLRQRRRGGRRRRRVAARGRRREGRREGVGAERAPQGRRRRRRGRARGPVDRGAEQGEKGVCRGASFGDEHWYVFFFAFSFFFFFLVVVARKKKKKTHTFFFSNTETKKTQNTPPTHRPSQSRVP